MQGMCKHTYVHTHKNTSQNCSMLRHFVNDWLRFKGQREVEGGHDLVVLNIFSQSSCF